MLEVTSRPVSSPGPKKSVHWAPLPLPERLESYDGKLYRREQTGLGPVEVRPEPRQWVLDPDEGSASTEVEENAE